MNLEEFYKELTAAGLAWTREEPGALCGDKTPALLRATVEPYPETHPGTLQTVCPITALCFLKTGVYFSTYDYERAAIDIGLEKPDFLEIVEAADKSPQTGAAFETVPELVAIRARLLEACGLERGKA